MNHLYSRYLNNELTPEELEQFLAHLRTTEGRDGLDRFMDSTWYQMYPEATPVIKVVPLIKRPWLRYAAAAVIVVAGMALWLFKPQQRAGRDAFRAIAQDVAPGGDKAVLTLADGRKIVLDSAANGVLALQQPGVNIIKSADGRLAYESDQKQWPLKAAWNTLSTPRGGKFRLTLPDGTRVWLNAATTLRYPVRFEGGERAVELSGEAYFEVVSGAKMPFKVVSAEQVVHVLGTDFNVNAYQDEESVKTTLLAGSVSIVPAAADTADLNKHKLLRPGQQSRVQNQQVFVSDKADIQQAVAWKDGQLVMRNLDTRALMRQISRWYDVEIVYSGVIPEGHFGGIIDQGVYLSNILEVLEAQGIHCRLENKKLYVSAK